MNANEPLALCHDYIYICVCVSVVCVCAYVCMCVCRLTLHFAANEKVQTSYCRPYKLNELDIYMYAPTRRGDAIVEVNGETIIGKRLNDVTNILRGPPGSTGVCMYVCMYVYLYVCVCLYGFA